MHQEHRFVTLSLGVHPKIYRVKRPELIRRMARRQFCVVPRIAYVTMVITHLSYRADVTKRQDRFGGMQLSVVDPASCVMRERRSGLGNAKPTLVPTSRTRRPIIAMARGQASD
jgi:hypothetical protein